jgi:hypothetical protein
MPVLQERPLRTARAHDQADPRARDHAFAPGGVFVQAKALVDAAMPPITRGLFRAREIWIDDALCRAARCRRVALRQRRVAAFVVVGLAEHVQANRISRIVRLGPSRCRCQNRRDHQNRQSRNAHQSLLRVRRRRVPDVGNRKAASRWRRWHASAHQDHLAVTARVPHNRDRVASATGCRRTGLSHERAR